MKTEQTGTALKIGYLPLAKGNWLSPWRDSMHKEGLNTVKNLSANHTIVGGETLVTTEDEARALLEKFETAQVDVVLCHFIGFASGTIPPLVVQRTKTPILFWSMPEPPMDGGPILANSFCAVNMNAHVMWKLGVPYLHVHAPVETAAAELKKALGPIAAVKRLRRTKIGLVGGRCQGFYPAGANELLLRRELGVEVESITLLELVDEANKMPAEKVDEALKLLKAGVTCAPNLAEADLRKGAALFAAFMEIKKKYNVDAFGVRCWAEFSRIYGIFVCSVVGLLNDQSIVASCEGDIYGTVTTILENELSGGGIPFFADLISIDGEDNTGVFWHCGAAPCSLANPACPPKIENFRTEDKGLMNQFPLKPGRVTIARIGETRDSNGFRMLIATGEAVETKQILRANPLRVRFDAPMDRVKKTLIYQGFEHHFSVIHGEVTEELLNFCQLLNIEPVLLQ